MLEGRALSQSSLIVTGKGIQSSSSSYNAINTLMKTALLVSKITLLIEFGPEIWTDCVNVGVQLSI